MTSESAAPNHFAGTRGNNQLRNSGGVRQNLWPIAAMAALLIGTVLALRSQGRLWWCECDRYYPWSGNVWSRHNSQHWFDPYSFTHVVHGLFGYGILTWFLPRLSLAWRLWLAVLGEALFEVFENTEFVINRYRTATASLDYHGDAIANSVGDILSFVLGFVLARRIGLWKSIALFLVIEVVLIACMRDSLLLNVLMLTFPLEAVKQWQLGH